MCASYSLTAKILTHIICQVSLVVKYISTKVAVRDVDWDVGC